MSIKWRIIDKRGELLLELKAKPLTKWELFIKFIYRFLCCSWINDDVDLSRDKFWERL